jgi:hypothetical protein
MASTYSDLKFELIGTGEQSGTWGVTTNTNIGTAIQEAITGSADVTFASGTVTLTLTNTNASQTARNLRLNLTGTSGGAQDLIVPTIEKFYLVNNGCADAITVKNSTGTGVAVPAGKAMLVFNNGTDVVEGITYITALETSTATIGTLTLTNDLAIAQGGTGASTADSALTNLGGTTTGKAVFTAADAAAVRTAAGAGAVGGSVFTAATAATAQQAMDTEVGVDVQAYDADLTALGGLAKTDGNFIVGNGTTWVAESGATARTSLGLGTLATLSTVNAATITDNSVGAAELNVPGNGTAGQYLASDGDGTMTWTTLVAGGGFSSMQVFTSPGTWTNPGNITKVKVTVVGGGGAGGDPGNTCGGGGGGGTAIEVIPFPSGTNVTVTRGAGSNTGTGGTSSFGPYCSATGGATGGNGGLGGIGSGGQLNIAGGTGSKGGLDLNGTANQSGPGGNSYLGAGGLGYSQDNPSKVGRAYGGGGAGRAGNGNRGAGAAGVVVVEF